MFKPLTFFPEYSTLLTDYPLLLERKEKYGNMIDENCWNLTFFSA